MTYIAEFDREVDIPLGYKQIPGFKGYVVNRSGSVLGLFRTTDSRTGAVAVDVREKAWLKCGKRPYRQVALTLLKADEGWSAVNDRSERHKNERRKLVHRVVWETFKGEIPDGMQIDHIDGDPLNNSLGNLRLVTPMENAHNPVTRARVAAKKKLTEAEELAVVKMAFHRVATQKKIGEMFGISPAYVQCLLYKYRDVAGK